MKRRGRNKRTSTRENNSWEAPGSDDINGLRTIMIHRICVQSCILNIEIRHEENANKIIIYILDLRLRGGTPVLVQVG